MQPQFEAKADEIKSKAEDIKAKAADISATVKDKLGAAGRQLKKVDLRKQIVDYPFAAIGIAAAAGAVVALVRPAPERGRVSGALISTLGLIGFRLIREAAVRELGTFAKNFVMNRDNDAQTDSFGGNAVEGGNVRYTPAL